MRAWLTPPLTKSLIVAPTIVTSHFSPLMRSEQPIGRSLGERLLALMGFHVAQVALLLDRALEAWGLLWAAIERAGMLPGQVGQVVIPLIPKPDGGLRPIGAFSALYRVCMRARSPYADRWECGHEREWFAASRGRGALGQVWRQAVRAELASGGRRRHACILWDLA